MLLLTALYFMSFSATGETLNGKVVAVPDANTIIVLDNDYLRQKVTLKSVHMPKGKAVLAGIAQQFLWTLLHGKPVRVEWQSWDKYGRRVGRVFLEDKDVALIFLREGFARWAFPVSPDTLCSMMCSGGRYGKQKEVHGRVQT